MNRAERATGTVIGSSRAFFERLVLPQIFFLLFMILIGAARAEAPREVVLKVMLLGYCLGVGYTIQRLLPVVRIRLAIVFSAGYALLLTVYGLLLGVDPLLSVQIIGAGAIVVLAVARLPLQVHVLVASGFFLPLVLYSLILYLLGSHGAGEYVWLPALALALSTVLMLLLPVTKLPTPADVSMSVEGEYGAETAPAVESHEQDLLLLAQHTLARSCVAEVVPFIAGSMVLFSVAVAVRLSVVEAWLGVLVTLIVVLAILLTLQRSTHAVFGQRVLATLVIAVLLGAPLIEVVISGTDRTLALAMVFSALLMVTVPWSARWQVVLALCSVGVVLATLLLVKNISGATLFALMLMPLPLVFMLIGGGNVRNLVIMRAAVGMIRRLNQSRADTLAVVRLCAWWGRELCGAPSVLLLRDDSCADILRGSSAEQSAVPQIFVEGLRSVLQERDGDVGVVPSRLLGEQFITAFVRWFNREPSELVYGRISPSRGRARHWYVVIPMMGVQMQARRRKGVTSVRDLVGLVNALLGAWDVGSRTSDTLRHTEELVARRDKELQDLIHLVNNTSQSIAALCDDVLQHLPHGQASLAVRDIGLHTNNLAAAVSDSFLRRELLSGQPGRRPETVAWDSFAALIEGYCRLRVGRRGLPVRVQLAVEDPQQVSTASSELLGTAVRLLLDRAGSFAESSGSLAVVAKRQEAQLELRIEALSAAAGRGHEPPLSEEELQRLTAFFEAAGGRFTIEDGRADNRYTIVIWLRQVSASLPQAEHRGWCLFVDDNPQMTNFYGRAAEALGIRAYIAETVGAARELLTQHGAPRLAVTDMQLPDGSGREVVELIRKQFANVPVVVVSGEQLDLVRAQLAGQGVRRFLVKPLGRAKLIGALEEVLSESGSS